MRVAKNGTSMKKIIKTQLKVLLVFLVGFLLFLLFTSCKSKIQYVPVESVRTEYEDKYLRDSIYLKELVRIYQRGDTVFKDSVVYKY